MLSGGGVLGFYHLGVVKTLLEQGLLPRVISGSSAGSIVAGVMGTHTNEELEHFIEPANVHFEAEREASVFSRMFFGANPQIDVGDLEQAGRAHDPRLDLPGGLREDRPPDQHHRGACGDRTSAPAC